MRGSMDPRIVWKRVGSYGSRLSQPADMQQYLQGVNWPADEEQVAQTVESNGVPQGMQAS